MSEYVYEGEDQCLDRIKSEYRSVSGEVAHGRRAGCLSSVERRQEGTHALGSTPSLPPNPCAALLYPSKKPSHTCPSDTWPTLPLLRRAIFGLPPSPQPDEGEKYEV